MKLRPTPCEMDEFVVVGSLDVTSDLKDGASRAASADEAVNATRDVSDIADQINGGDRKPPHEQASPAEVPLPKALHEQASPEQASHQEPPHEEVDPTDHAAATSAEYLAFQSKCGDFATECCGCVRSLCEAVRHLILYAMS